MGRRVRTRSFQFIIENLLLGLHKDRQTVNLEQPETLTVSASLVPEPFASADAAPN